MHGDGKNRDKDDIDFLKDLLLETQLPLSGIAQELGWSISQVNKTINSIGLTWLKNSRKKMSRGQSALTEVMKKLLPKEQIINEYHIGDKLKLDVYCPKYAIAAEYHGRQHYYYTSRFFDSKYEFEESVKRDQKKEEWCKDNGVALIVFRYTDSLSEESVFNRLIEAIRSNPYKPKEKLSNSITSSEAYKIIKKKNSDYKKNVYRSMKKKKKS